MNKRALVKANGIEAQFLGQQRQAAAAIESLGMVPAYKPAAPANRYS